MNRQPGNTKRYGPALAATSTMLSILLAGSPAFGQVPVDENGNPVAMTPVSVETAADIENPRVESTAEFSAGELEALVGPIALYPDDLLAVVLPASTYPLEVVQAARFLERLEADPSIEPDDDWDDSIVALLNYPDVVKLMNEDLDWTWELGDAVVRQQEDVVLAIETFRDRAYAAGNLESDDRQLVSRNDSGVIEIDPVQDDVLYVPYYEPERVVYTSPTPVYHYYPRAYPVYYYPYPHGYRFSSGAFWGVTTAFSIGWSTNHLHVYHQSYRGHPFYGYNYGFHGGYWRRPSINVYNNWYVNRLSPHYRYRHYRGDYWRPREHRRGARPITRVRNQGYANPRRTWNQRGNRVADPRSRPDLNLRSRPTTRVGNTRGSDRRVGGNGSRRSREALGTGRNPRMPGRVATRRGTDGNDGGIRFRSRPAAATTAERRANPARRDTSFRSTGSRRQPAAAGAGGDRGASARSGRTRAASPRNSGRVAAGANSRRPSANRPPPRASRSLPASSRSAGGRSRPTAGSARNARPAAARSNGRASARVSGRSAARSAGRSAGRAARPRGSGASGRQRGRGRPRG